MASSALIQLNRRLSGVALVGSPGPLVDEREVAVRVEAAYRRGAAEARAIADHQITELRREVLELTERTLANLTHAERFLAAQLQQALPELIVAIGRRLLAGTEVTADLLARLCAETLQELVPERENLELLLAPADAALVQAFAPGLQASHPGLRITADPALTSGDCLVRSRFGVTDARRATKLAALGSALAAGASARTP
jgi:flagellar assembly protein FliH